MQTFGMRDGVLTTLRQFARLGCAITMTAFAAGIAFAQTPEAPSVMPPMIGTGVLPRDLSPWVMFRYADVVVQSVMVGLVFASLVTWTAWVFKTLQLGSVKRKARDGLRVLKQARTLAEAAEQIENERDAVGQLVRAAELELQMSTNLSAEGVKERITLLLERIEAGAARRVGHGMGVLASIGATAPFVGLFGAVWGIMNSFIGVSEAHTMNLAIVAPGIAEALFATALGLFAAIPAVVIYNVFARSIGGYQALLADASALVMQLASRDCERKGLPLSRAAE